MKIDRALVDIDTVRPIDWAVARQTPWVWIGLLWFLFVFPAIVLHGAHYEEGTVIGLARGAFEEGHWLEPHRYGERFAERPVLVSWLLGAIGLVTGSIPIWLARMPTVLAVLCGALLIAHLVRRYASDAAAAFAALCFMACPLILRKVIVAEVDLVLSVVLFATLVVWWGGERQGGVSWVRWLAIGLMLTAAALIKGPQPLGFFFIGLGALFLLRRQWSNLFKLGVTGLIPAAATLAWYASVFQAGDVQGWLSHSRLGGMSIVDWVSGTVSFVTVAAVDFAPAWLLLVPVAWRVIKQPQSERDALLAALILYAGVCFVILAVWPGARGRYAMPAILATAAAAGLVFDRMRFDRPMLVRIACAFLAACVLYRVVLGWLLMPAMPDLFGKSRYYGQAIAEVVSIRPQTIYTTTPIYHDVFVYVPYRVEVANFASLVDKPGPVWIILDATQLQALRAARPNQSVVLHLASRWPSEWRLVEIRDRSP